MTEKKRATFEKPLIKTLCFRLGISTDDIGVSTSNLYTDITSAWCVFNDKNCKDGGISIHTEIREEVLTDKNKNQSTSANKYVAIEGMDDPFGGDENVYIENVLKICKMLKDHFKMEDFGLEFFYQDGYLYLV